MNASPAACFALLDDSAATGEARTSRLYTVFSHERRCDAAAQLDEVCAAVDADLRDGLFAVVIADYAFDPEGKRRSRHGAGALRFLLFRECRALTAHDAAQWLEGREAPAPAGVVDLTESIDRAGFDRAIAAIHEALRAGDTYQVNFTYRMHFGVFGTPLALYRRLRARQPVHFGALIALPDGASIVSLSPELFLDHRDGVLRARPMKGTAPHQPDAGNDARTARQLAADPKNRAENVMIVDLLRNDLGRVAETGSVTVPALFSVESYPTVWQMTSSIEARLRGGTTFADLLRALYPCGSITGAPKHSTMRIIDSLESTPRGLYTGAIGWLDAPRDGRAGAGDFCLSVAIRTVVLEPAGDDGLRAATMGVGAGIVLDSVASAEFDECRLKARFLTGMDPGFALFETLYVTREAGVRHWDRHLARLGAAATRFGFPYDERALRQRMAELAATLPVAQPCRARLSLDHDGSVRVDHAPLVPLAQDRVTVMLASAHGFGPTDERDFLLGYKTTHRTEYDAAWRAAEQRGGFDMLFVNRQGQLTEGGRSNVFVRLDGRWWTPPLRAGVLPGVMRGVALTDPRYGAAERTLTPADLRAADDLMVCNALRGMLPARLVDEVPHA